MPGLQVFKLFMAFLRTSLTVLTTCARIMCIWCTLVIKNLSSIKGFSEHYKICLTQDGWPPREIKLGITSANLLQYCFSRIVPEMAINCKVLYKTVCRLTQKKYRSPQTLYGFFENFSDCSLSILELCVFGVACCHQFNGATERNQITKFIIYKYSVI